MRVEGFTRISGTRSCSSGRGPSQTRCRQPGRRGGGGGGPQSQLRDFCLKVNLDTFDGASEVGEVGDEGADALSWRGAPRHRVVRAPATRGDRLRALRHRETTGYELIDNRLRALRHQSSVCTCHTRREATGYEPYDDNRLRALRRQQVTSPSMPE